MSILGRIMDKLFGGRTISRYPRPLIAPSGYDPTQDPDGSQYARLVGQQMPGGGGVIGTIWEGVIRPLWWVWLIVGVMAVWGWWWWVARPAKIDAQAVATSTAVAALWTPTWTPPPTETPTADRPTPTADRPTPTADRPTPTADRPTPTADRPTPTWTPPPTETPLPTETPTPTGTPTPTNTPIWPTPTPTAVSSASLASGSAVAGENMVITGFCNNGSIVQVKWQNGELLAQVTPRKDGTWAASIVVPAVAARGYYLIRVEWTGGGIDLVLALAVPTYTPTPIPTATATAIIPTPTSYPTPIGGWPFRLFFPLIYKSWTFQPL